MKNYKREKLHAINLRRKPRSRVPHRIQMCLASFAMCTAVSFSLVVVCVICTKAKKSYGESCTKSFYPFSLFCHFLSFDPKLDPFSDAKGITNQFSPFLSITKLLTDSTTERFVFNCRKVVLPHISKIEYW